METSFSCTRIVLPDSHQKKLPSKFEIKKAFDTLKLLVDQGITFVHCFASVERSPLLCILFVMERFDLNLEESLDYVKRVHKLTNPRNYQLFLIKEYFF